MLLEDEDNLGATLVEWLSTRGFKVTWVSSLAQGSKLLESDTSKQAPDLFLLDVGLPDGSGFDFAEQIRARFPERALIFLTAFGSPDDRIRGLELGAEDYITKPFHLRELELRIQHCLRRSSYLQGPNHHPGKTFIGQAEIDFAAFEVVADGIQTRLTQKEWALLKFLSENQGRAVSRDEILNQVWGTEAYPSPRTVDNFIVRLRKFIEPDPEQPRFLLSIRGVGYQLTHKGSE